MTTTNNSDPPSQASPRGQANREPDESHRGSWAQAPGAPAFRARSSTASRALTFDSKLALLPGVTIPLRSMLITGSEQQILISPVGTAAEAAQMATSRLALVAPSLLHHLHLRTAIERYHPLTLWGPPGLAEKKPELGPIFTFGVDPWPHGDQLAFVVIEGAPKRNEVVFFHPPSRTIYTADLFFNILEPEGFLTPLAFRMMGIYRRFATGKMWRRWVTDKAAFGRSIDQILAWDFDRIVVAHGASVEDHARDRFEIALRELALLA
jgi:hypothetical protein